MFIGGFIAAVIYMILVFSDRADNFLGGLCLGITFGMMIVGAIMTSKYAAQIRAFKMRLLHRKYQGKSVGQMIMGIKKHKGSRAAMRGNHSAGLNPVYLEKSTFFCGFFRTDADFVLQTDGIYKP